MIVESAEFRTKPRKPVRRCNVWQGLVIACTLRLALTSYLCSEKQHFQLSWVR